MIFFQIFYYECVAIGGSCEPGPVVVPCLSLWTEEAISEREKQEKELGGYGCGEVRVFFFLDLNDFFYMGIHVHIDICV